MKNKKRYLLFITITIGILMLIGASYAYFQAQINNNAISNVKAITGTTDNLVFITEGDILIEADTDNFGLNDERFLKGTSIAKAILTANNTTNEAKEDYNVYVDIIENEFKYSSYTNATGEVKVKRKVEEEIGSEYNNPRAELILRIKDPEGNVVGSIESKYEIKNKKYIESIRIEEEEIEGGYDITEEKDLLKIELKEKEEGYKYTKEIRADENNHDGEESIPYKKTDKWEVEIRLINLETEQRINEGKKLKGEVIIQKEEKVYEIKTIEDLVKLSKEVNEGDTKKGKTYVLSKDLDFSNPSDYEDSTRTDYGDINGNGIEEEGLLLELTTGSGFIPIGKDANHPFQGNFDGKNHTLSKLYINNNISSVILGVFGIIKNTNIKNIILNGEINSQTTATIGSIAGRALGENNIDNVKNYVNIISESSSWDVGGILGENSSGSRTNVSNCINFGKVSGGSHTGGIIGYNKSELILQNITNYGNLTNNLGDYIGGIIGISQNQLKISNTHNEGEVNSNNNKIFKYMGGLVGQTNGDTEINDSYNTGNVTANGENGVNIGGLVGAVQKKIIINNSYNSDNTIKISPNGFDTNEYIGGLIGSIYNQVETSIIKNSYNGGEIINGNRVGGIVGTIQAGVIIDKCYNNGDINVTGEILGSGSQIGGLIGNVHSWSYTHPADIILNSYNTGNIVVNNMSITYISGVSNNTNSNKLFLLNSYNVGNLELQSSVGNSRINGIILSAGTKSESTEKNINILKNVYTLGTITGMSTNKYNLGYFDPNTTNNINNTYYLNNENIAGSNISDLGTPKTIDEIKTQAFVDELNKNVDTIDLKTIDSSLEGYKLCKWKLGENNYPELIFE